MRIREEITVKLNDAMRQLADAPRRTTFMVVLNTGARNEYISDPESRHDFALSGPMAYTFRGAHIAWTEDDNFPRVTVFTRAK